jgi:hypothetical protein
MSCTTNVLYGQLVRLEGFEPPTTRVEAEYSILLSYSRIWVGPGRFELTIVPIMSRTH